jgi:hypothetical protein
VKQSAMERVVMWTTIVVLLGLEIAMELYG